MGACVSLFIKSSTHSTDSKKRSCTQTPKHECPICFAQLSETLKIIIQPCGHVMCRNCYDGWSINCNKEIIEYNCTSCPQCRSVFNKKKAINSRNFYCGQFIGKNKASYHPDNYDRLFKCQNNLTVLLIQIDTYNKRKTGTLCKKCYCFPRTIATCDSCKYKLLGCCVQYKEITIRVG